MVVLDFFLFDVGKAVETVGAGSAGQWLFYIQPHHIQPRSL
ncbi:MAG: hypothetical protein ACJAXR_002347 [Halopseudomonas sp.]|jgi:hypothetical protein